MSMRTHTNIHTGKDPDTIEMKSQKGLNRHHPSSDASFQRRRRETYGGDNGAVPETERAEDTSGCRRHSCRASVRFGLVCQSSRRFACCKVDRFLRALTCFYVLPGLGHIESGYGFARCG